MAAGSDLFAAADGLVLQLVSLFVVSLRSLSPRLVSRSWNEYLCQHAALWEHLARARFPRCTFVRQEGLWMHHLRAVPAAEVQRHDYVLLMIDGVEMNADVDLQMLVHIMQANCLSVSGPACGSGKSKQLIHPQYQTEVGRRVQYIDPQITLYTSAAFLCLQRLIDVVGLEHDPSGWSISALSTSYCSNRVGIVDAMSVEKIYVRIA